MTRSVDDATLRAVARHRDRGSGQGGRCAAGRNDADRVQSGRLNRSALILSCCRRSRYATLAYRGLVRISSSSTSSCRRSKASRGTVVRRRSAIEAGSLVVAAVDGDPDAGGVERRTRTVDDDSCGSVRCCSQDRPRHGRRGASSDCAPPNALDPVVAIVVAPTSLTPIVTLAPFVATTPLDSSLTEVAQRPAAESVVFVPLPIRIRSERDCTGVLDRVVG